jgi:hypothetical protein
MVHASIIYSLYFAMQRVKVNTVCACLATTQFFRQVLNMCRVLLNS